ncbi:hypothetical protein I79_009167 [Cricetulus griseus]|uniref:Uncharacterized protein n=1 Tax=Cricetulus griseus TaxID=10029 RepID=G3HF14_CRIGR|nr:hypothetical protein I79_009167 [Cricetulus griseus]
MAILLSSCTLSSRHRACKLPSCSLLSSSCCSWSCVFASRSTSCLVSLETARNEIKMCHRRLEHAC